MARRRPTSADVAREAGVSRATVSYVLNDTPHQSIPDQTRQRVFEAARKLAYSPSAAARALRAGRSDLVVAVMPAGPIGVVTGYVLNALSAQLAADGLTFVIHLHTPGSRPVREVWQAATPAAVVALGSLRSVDRQDLATSGAAVLVTLTADPEPLQDSENHTLEDSAPGPATVLVEFAGAAAARAQVQHLLEEGHRRLAVAQFDDPQVQVGALAAIRLGSVREACRSAGLPEPLLADVGDDATASAATIRAWADAGVTAVCAYNDEVALAVLAAAHDAGLKVPDDIAVIGMDDIPSARSAQPPLSTVALNPTALGEHVTAIVRAALDGAPLPTTDPGAFAHVVRRAST